MLKLKKELKNGKKKLKIMIKLKIKKNFIFFLNFLFYKYNILLNMINIYTLYIII